MKSFTFSHFYFTGMSDLSCDRQVILNDYLKEGTLDRVYVYSGPAGRISNRYTYEDGSHVEIPKPNRSKPERNSNMFTCACVRFFGLSEEIHYRFSSLKPKLINI